ARRERSDARRRRDPRDGPLSAPRPRAGRGRCRHRCRLRLSRRLRRHAAARRTGADGVEGSPERVPGDAPAARAAVRTSIAALACWRVRRASDKAAAVRRRSVLLAVNFALGVAALVWVWSRFGAGALALLGRGGSPSPLAGFVAAVLAAIVVSA